MISCFYGGDQIIALSFPKWKMRFIGLLHYIPGINSNCSWCIIIFIYHWFWFAKFCLGALHVGETPRGKDFPPCSLPCVFCPEHRPVSSNTSCWSEKGPTRETLSKIYGYKSVSSMSSQANWTLQNLLDLIYISPTEFNLHNNPTQSKLITQCHPIQSDLVEQKQLNPAMTMLYNSTHNNRPRLGPQDLTPPNTRQFMPNNSHTRCSSHSRLFNLMQFNELLHQLSWLKKVGSFGYYTKRMSIKWLFVDSFEGTLEI